MDKRRWEHLWQIFDDALERSPEDRGAFLATACAGDASMREEIDSLLASHENAGSFIGGAVASAAGDVVASSGMARGQRIGAYEVIRPIGRGGMGEVYLAVRADDEYHQEVAIKIVRGGLDSPEILKRFLAERQILANLGHANIARLLDGGTTEGGSAYVVMEYVDGEPIDRFCDRMRLDTRSRLNLFRQVCSAVQHAHRNLVVHRDIKPGNILVTPDGIPKLLDFGIAKILDPGGADGGPALTRTAIRLLTPEYASPEQVKGEAITTATDVYSLGVLLFHLLTGRLPYRITSDKQADLEQAICDTAPERPSTAVTREPDRLAMEVEPSSAEAADRSEVSEARRTSPEGLSRQLRGDLDNIVLMALRKEPERRYASADQFSEDIQRFLNGLPVMARQDSWGYRTAKFVGRNRLGVVAAAGVVLLLAGVSVTMTIQSFRIARERDRALVAEARAKSQAATTEQVSRFMVDLFGGVDPEEARGREITAREILDRGAERIRRELNEQPEVRARLQGTMGEVYGNIGLYDEATPLLEESLRQLVELHGEESLEAADARARLASLLQTRGAYDEADEQLTRVLEIRRELLAPDHPDLAKSLDRIGLLRRLQGRYEEAETAIREALDGARASGESEHKDERIALYTNHLGLVLKDRGDSAEAEVAFREALALQIEVLGEDHPQVGSTLGNLGDLLARMSRFDEAEQLLQKGLDLHRRLYGDEHVVVATQINNLASFYKEMGDLETAEARQREALAIYRKNLGENHYYVAMSYNNLANILQDEGELDAAEAMHRKSLALHRKILGNDHPKIGDCLNNLANLLWEGGKLDESESLYKEALALERKLLGGDHPYIAMDLNNLAIVPRDGGDLDGAMPLVNEAIDIITRAEGADSPTVALYVASRAALYLKMGRNDDAEKEIHEALRIQRKTLPEGNWRILQNRSILGEILAALGRKGEAEQVLIESYEGLSDRLGEKNGYTRRARKAVHAFYESTAQPDKAAAYASSR